MRSPRSRGSPTPDEQRSTDPEVRELHRSRGSRILDNDPPAPLRSHGLLISDEQPSTLGVRTSPRSRGSHTPDEQRSTDPEVRELHRSRGSRISDNDQRPANPEVRTPLHGNRPLTPDERQSTGPEAPAPRSFEDACRRIDEVAEVIQPSVPSPRSDHSIPGARSWKARIER